MDEQEIEWDNSIENLLQRFADEASVRESLHRTSYYKYKKLQTCFQLPIIILSALCGSITFISKSYKSAEEILLNITGGTSILVSIVSAVSSYLKLGETKQQNLKAEIEWQHFFNSIKYELALRREYRTNAAEFISKVKVDYERLFEISPIVNQEIINATKSKLKKHVDHTVFQIPNYLNGFRHTSVYGTDSEGDD